MVIILSDEPFLDLLRHRSQSLMRPSRHIAIDEALILWKGRLGFRQFIKIKRARFGIKVFVLCPTGKGWDGYSWNFEVYYGKGNYKNQDPAASNLSVSEDIVVHLMKDLLDHGCHVVTDNWYTSIRLSDYLQTRNTMLTGVVRAGRGPPKSIINAKLERQQSVFARKGNTLVVKYHDKREVTVLTTKYKADMVEKTKTYFGQKTTFCNKPLHIDRYNNKMGSVDMADQLLEPYASERKSLAWFKKLGIHFVFRALLNSYIFYKNECQYRRPFLSFITEVVKGWLNKNSPGAAFLLKVSDVKKAKRSSAEEVIVHAWIRHENCKKQKRCRICTKVHKKRKDTTYYCPGCPDEPGLCSLDHFREWHSMQRDDPDDPQPGPSGTREKRRKKN